MTSSSSSSSSSTIIPQFTSQEELKLINWFQSSGGILSEKCSISNFNGMGRGFKARTKIEENELLFSIPRHLLLNINTSLLSTICKEFDEELIGNISSNSDIMMIDIETKNHDANEEEKIQQPLSWNLIQKKGGWAGLILSIMWENWRVSEIGRKNWESFNENRMNPWTSSSEMDGDEKQEGNDERNERNQRFREEERPKGNQEWGPYLDLLPKKFDTPMFWNEEELKELKGTNVIDKVGRTEMDQTYYDLVLPYIQSRPSIFFGLSNNLDESKEKIKDFIEKFYSLENYHRMGSAILSRSFHVEKPENEDDDDDEEEEEEGKDNDAEVEAEGSRDLDETEENEGEEEETNGIEETEGLQLDESDDEEEDPDQERLEDISLTPMADLLNAKYESDNVSTPRAAGLNLFGGNPSRAVLELHRAEKNGGKEARARLFYKALTLEMRATKPIEAGEQIFNTYGNPPNSDLLRRYSHVDQPNGNDIVELSVENLINGLIQSLFQNIISEEIETNKINKKELYENLTRRLEWAFEHSLLDDVFILSYPFKPSSIEPFGTGTEIDGLLKSKDFRKACKIDNEIENGKISKELLIGIKLLLISDEEFKKCKKKISLPQGGEEIDGVEEISSKSYSSFSSTSFKTREISIAEVITFSIKDRLKSYETSLEFDEKLLFGIGNCKEDSCEKMEMKNERDEKKKKALIVRIGEKRILRDNELLFEFVRKEVEKEIEKKEKKKKEKKRSMKEVGGGDGKRRKA